MFEHMLQGMSLMKKVGAFNELMGSDCTGAASGAGAVERIERLSALSFELRRPEGLRRSIELARGLLARGLPAEQSSMLHCCLANAWGRIRALSRPAGGDVWDWEQPELEMELGHLRLALESDGLRGVPREVAGGALSDMATLLNHVGRSSEALECWDMAVSWEPTLAVARGRRGYALTQYAHALYDTHHVETFLRCARYDLARSLEGDLPAGARGLFGRRLQWVVERLRGGPIDKDADLLAPAPGMSGEEVYRRWCLDNRLFLSPLNDLGPVLMGARDTLFAPAEIGAGDHGAFFAGYLSQIKQEYVSARFLFYDGLNGPDTGFPDRGALLFDTRGFLSQSLGAEKIKASFTIAYALLNKVADFVNRYLGLGAGPEETSFGGVWYERGSRDAGIRAALTGRRNWPLRGLFWLSKDLDPERPSDPEQTGTDAPGLADIGRSITRGYLRLYDGAEMGDEGRPAFKGPGCNLSMEDFESRTLRLLKMSRAAIVYLCLALHFEMRREAGRKTRAKAGPHRVRA